MSLHQRLTFPLFSHKHSCNTPDYYFHCFRTNTHATPQITNNQANMQASLIFQFYNNPIHFRDEKICCSSMHDLRSQYSCSIHIPLGADCLILAAIKPNIFLVSAFSLFPKSSKSSAFNSFFEKGSPDH